MKFVIGLSRNSALTNLSKAGGKPPVTAQSTTLNPIKKPLEMSVFFSPLFDSFYLST